MSQCIRQTAVCARSSLWVPEHFHPEDTLPSKLLRYAQHACCIMHSVVTRLAYGERNAGARLKMQYLRNVVGTRHCEDILHALLSSGDLQCVDGYVPGRHSRAYRPAEEYLTQPLRRFVLTDPYLLDRRKIARQQAIARQAQYRRPIHDFWERSQRSLRLDWDEACDILQNLPIRSNPYGIQGMLIEQIRNRQFRLSVDPYGRVHNNITSLHRTLRPALRVNREKLAHVDIVNSQPAFLAVLVMQRGKTPTVTGGDHWPPWSSVVEHGRGGPNTIYDAAPFGPTEGGGEYQRLAISGQLYEHMIAKTGMARDAVKKSLLRDVLGKRGHYPCPLEWAFRDEFPGIYRFIKSFNRDHYAALLRELQRVESDLVIHRVGQRLQELKCIGCISLHDAVFCAQRDIRMVERAFSDAFETAGVWLKLKVKY